MILNPMNMELMDWADSFALFYESEGSPVQKLEDPSKWQEWAMNMVGEPDQLGQDAPDPYQFDDWRDWASRLFATVELN